MNDLRTQLLSIVDKVIEPVEVPEWNRILHVRSMTVKSRTLFEQVLRDDSSKVRAALVALTLCDEEGNLVFTLEDLDAIDEMSGAALEKIVTASISLNDLKGESAEKN